MGQGSVSWKRKTAQLHALPYNYKPLFKAIIKLLQEKERYLSILWNIFDDIEFWVSSQELKGSSINGHSKKGCIAVLVTEVQ